MDASILKNQGPKPKDSNTLNVTDTDASQFSDYEHFFLQAGVNFEKKGAFLFCGSIDAHDGWVIYLSVVTQRMSFVMQEILPELVKEGVAFSIPENKTVHQMLLDGALGYNNIGKVVAVFPRGERSALEIARYLIQAAQSVQGPAMPVAKRLGNCVYAQQTRPAETRARIKNNWPFRTLARDRNQKHSSWLKGPYFKVQCLKHDAKGNVYKGLDLRRWSNIQWCVIKEGKSHQCTDDAGRSIKDRLKWQFRVQSRLEGLVALPGAIDFFDDQGDSYFVMEYCEGISLHDKFAGLQSGKIWHELEPELKATLIAYLLQAVEIIGCLHEQGFIHRDLSPVNFIVSAKDRLSAIDIELAYNYVDNEPCPAFTLGTAGYMSPAQQRMESPTTADDIFGFGALLIKTLAGMAPTKFNTAITDSLYRNLLFFIGNPRLVTLICACLNEDARQRPELSTVKHNLALYHSLILTKNDMGISPGKYFPNSKEINEVIGNAIKALWQYPMLSKDKKWYSLPDNQAFPNSGKPQVYFWSPGFYTGACGVMYMLNKADCYGFDAIQNRDIFFSNFDCLWRYYQEQGNLASPGLYSGAAGFCVLMAEMIRNSNLEKNIGDVDFITRLLSLPNQLVNVADGLAGQGIAMMRCAELLDFFAFDASLQALAAKIIRQQQSDGSWAVKRDLSSKSAVKHTGLLYGIAGITYFLLDYGFKYHNVTAQQAALKGLSWLLKQQKSASGQLIWTVNPKNRYAEPWMAYGFSGIALLLIKAFNILKDPAYQQAASSALFSHPKLICSNYLSQANGLSGLGEIYLEAHKVFGEAEWLERAGHIAALLLHSGKEQTDGSIYWLDGSDSATAADFMSGNSGIIHFLLRYNYNPGPGFPMLTT